MDFTQQAFCFERFGLTGSCGGDDKFNRLPKATHPSAMNKARIKFHALLHFAESLNNGINLKNASGEALYRTLAGCVSLMVRSAKSCGYEVVVHTNNPDRLVSLLSEISPGLVPEIRELQSDTYAPPIDIPFYSAHYKLALIESLAKQLSEISGIVDIDTVFIKPLPNWIIDLADDGSAIAYDITSQVLPQAGAERLMEDLERVSASRLPPRWFGGEFLLASGRVYGELKRSLDDLWPRYCACYRTVHHQGDEMVVSAALQLCASRGLKIVDAGSFDVIRRFWSVRTRHRQSSLYKEAGHSILHLPSDKHFLNRTARTSAGWDPIGFQRRYGVQWRVRRFGSKLKASLFRQERQ